MSASISAWSLIRAAIGDVRRHKIMALGAAAPLLSYYICAAAEVIFKTRLGNRYDGFIVALILLFPVTMSSAACCGLWSQFLIRTQGEAPLGNGITPTMLAYARQFGASFLLLNLTLLLTGALVISGVPTAICGIIFGGCIVMCCYCYLRWNLARIIAAVENQPSLSASWHLTRGRVRALLRLYQLWLLVLLAAVLAILLEAGLFTAFCTWETKWLSHVHQRNFFYIGEVISLFLITIVWAASILLPAVALLFLPNVIFNGVLLRFYLSIRSPAQHLPG